MDNALIPAHQIEGLDPHTDRGDLIIPRISIVQPTSAAAVDGDAVPGTFVSNLMGEVYEQINIVPLRLRKERTKFSPDENRPVCRSYDAVRPAGYIESPVNKECAVWKDGRLVDVCPDSIWCGGPPKCRREYRVLALNLDACEMPFLIKIKGKSYKAAKKLISYLAMRQLSPFSVSCLMQLSKRVEGSYKYYVINFINVSPIDPPDKYRARFLEFREYDASKTDEAEEAAPESSGDDENLPF
jgi:hypothetical protein